jgi:hypothetical protein
VLRDVWGLHKWIANSPARQGIDQWAPTRNLRAHAAKAGWVDTLLSV